jgi:Tfp pilus assembly protein PilN
MDRDLFALIQEAKTWLASEAEPQILSLEWQTHNALRLFIDVLQKDSSLLSLEMAIQTLRRHMVSKFDWTAEYSKTVSRFCAQADQIRRRMSNAGVKKEIVR